jgi:calcineurin-like phosphoesterase family protein
MNYYIADLHLDHANIIRYCQRPYRDVAEMNVALLAALRAAEAAGATLYVLGDVSLHLGRFVERYGWLAHPERHTVVIGNHDRALKHAAIYAQCFGTVIGTEKTYRTNFLEITDTAQGTLRRLLLSHYPQRDLRGADLNLYGHHHNNVQLYPERFVGEEWHWLLASTRHINVGVERLGYRPQTLSELVALTGAPTREELPRNPTIERR